MKTATKRYVTRYWFVAVAWTAACWGFLVHFAQLQPSNSPGVWAVGLLHPLFATLFFVSSLGTASLGRSLFEERAGLRDIPIGLALTTFNVFLFALLCLIPSFIFGSLAILAVSAGIWYVLAPMGVLSQFVMKAACRWEENSHA